MAKIVLILGLLFFFTFLGYFVTKRRKPKVKIVDISKFSNKILVNLEDCKIISGSIEQKEPPYINVMNPGGSAYSILSNSDVTLNSTYLIYTYNNIKFTAGPFDVSDIGAKAACLKQKTTYIYYNKADYSDYYFDANFIHAW